MAGAASCSETAAGTELLARLCDQAWQINSSTSRHSVLWLIFDCTVISGGDATQQTCARH
jgi:hypothetical protein